MKVKHAFTNPIADRPGFDGTQPSHWNADHTIEGEYATRTAAAAATISTGVDYLRTAGYSSPGDGGGALYKRVSSEPSHAGKFQSADGAWFELAERIVSPRMFGAKGDGVTDDTAALNAFWSYLLANPNQPYDVNGNFAVPAGTENRARIGSIRTPRGFVWDSNRLPFTAWRDANGRIQWEVDPKRLIPTEVWTAPLATQVFHVDPISGNDSTGTGIGTYRFDFSTAVKTLTKAITLANATENPSQIIVKCDSSPWMTRGQSGQSSGARNNSVALAVIAYGGRLRITASDAHTWAQDGTYTNTYSTSESNCSGVFDLLNTQIIEGKTLYQHLTKAADLATCNSTPGTWINTGGKTYVRRADGAAVTDANTLTLRNDRGLSVEGAASSYWQGIDFEGGFRSITAQTKNVVAEDCRARYGQLEVTTGQCWAFDNLTGVIALINCEGDMAGADLFNFKQAAGRSFALLAGCSGVSAGHSGTGSSNGLTGHEDCVVVDIGGNYRKAKGGTIRFVNSSQLWAIGTQARYDQGDGVTRSEFVANTQAQIWLDDTVAEADAADINALAATTAASRIHKRNHTTLVGLETGSGVVDTPL